MPMPTSVLDDKPPDATRLLSTSVAVLLWPVVVVGAVVAADVVVLEISDVVCEVVCVVFVEGVVVFNDVEIDDVDVLDVVDDDCDDGGVSEGNIDEMRGNVMTEPLVTVTFTAGARVVELATVVVELATVVVETRVIVGLRAGKDKRAEKKTEKQQKKNEKNLTRDATAPRSDTYRQSTTCCSTSRFRKRPPQPHPAKGPVPEQNSHGWPAELTLSERANNAKAPQRKPAPSHSYLFSGQF